MAATSASVAGNAHQTPQIFQTKERINAIGMITINPRSNEMICAGRGLSVDVKYMERMILYPAKGQAIKYRRSPSVAMDCSAASCSLLKIAVISDAPK